MKKPLFLLVCVLLLLLAGAAPALAHARTFVVHPSGDDDTATIQQAFTQAVATGPGSTVQLTAGHFYMNNILVQGFHGCFRGAGMERTVIDTLRGLDPGREGVTRTLDPVDPGTDEYPNYVEPWTFLIGFLGGGVRVSDMSFALTSPDPAEDWSVDGGETMLTDVSDIFVIARDASAAFDRVGFSAQVGDAQGYNTSNDIGIYGPTGGVHRVTRCSFSGRQGLEIVGLSGGRLTVGGSPAQRNVFRESFAGCYFYDNSDSDIIVSHNRMRATTGDNVLLWQGGGIFPDSVMPPLPAPRFAIRDNVMCGSKVTADDGSTVIGAGGVYVEDDSWFYGEPNRLDAVIADNTIALDNDGWDAGVDGFYAQDVKVLRNHISGTALAAIDVGTAFIPYFAMEIGPACGWRIVGNDVSGLEATNAQLEPGARTAPIWLGPGATGCLVVGQGRTRVLDEGTDNILVNVIRLPLPGAARAAVPMKSLCLAKALKPARRL
jgi:hypothetical protein